MLLQTELTECILCICRKHFYVSNDGGQTFEVVSEDLEAHLAKIKAVPGKKAMCGFRALYRTFIYN